MRSTSASGVTIRYDDRGGDEPALLLMPDWCADHSVYAGLTSRLAEKNRVLALDWRGHGESQHPEDDFDCHDLVQDALAVIEASGSQGIVPVAQAHAGWVAVELRRRLGERVPKLILLDWIVGNPPPDFLELLKTMQTNQWRDGRDRLFEVWRAGARNEELERYLDEVVSTFDRAMWARAARAIEEAYLECGNPLVELSRLDPPSPVLHLYSQPNDPAFDDMQTVFALKHPWYRFQRLDAQTHFGMFELPDQMAALIAEFAGTEARGKAA